MDDHVHDLTGGMTPFLAGVFAFDVALDKVTRLLFHQWLHYGARHEVGFNGLGQLWLTHVINFAARHDHTAARLAHQLHQFRDHVGLIGLLNFVQTVIKQQEPPLIRQPAQIGAHMVDARHIAIRQEIQQSRYARLQRGLLGVPRGARFKAEVIIAQRHVDGDFLTPEDNRAAAQESHELEEIEGRRLTRARFAQHYQVFMRVHQELVARTHKVEQR